MARNFDRVVRAEMERQTIPGVAVGIVDRRAVTARGYGFANVEHDVQVTAAADYYKSELVKLGHPLKTVLVGRREVGDDRLYLYELTFGDHACHARLGLAPDDGVSQFSLRPEP